MLRTNSLAPSNSDCPAKCNAPLFRFPSNIAEGHAREHLKEYLHHLSFAQASLAELETQIEIAARLDYLTSERVNGLLSDADSLGKQIRALQQALKRKLTGTI